jgi:hypothetical protein
VLARLDSNQDQLIQRLAVHTGARVERGDGVADREGTRGGLVGTERPGTRQAARGSRCSGGHRGPDFGLFEGERYSLVEGQFVPGDETTWRCFLYQWSTRSAVLLDIQTLGGSLAFANPTFTLLHSPAGAPALLVTLFVPGEGAAPGEAGELIYFHEL